MKRKSIQFVILLCTMLSFSACSKGDKESVEEAFTEEMTDVSGDEEKREEPKPDDENKNEKNEEEKQEVAEPDEVKQEVQVQNMIENADFSSGVGNWLTYLNGGEATLLTNEDGQLVIRVADCGNLDYSVQAYYDGFGIDQGVVYKFSFDLAVSKPRTVVWRIQLNGGDYHAYFDDTIQATTDMQHYEYEVTMTEPSDPAPRLCFNVGVYDQDGDLGEHDIYIDNLELCMLDASNKTDAGMTNTEMSIDVNQVGYRTRDTKIATLRKDAISKEFQVIDVKTEEVVFTGTLTDEKETEVVGEKTMTGDFSSVTEPGTYKLRSGDAESVTFVIADNAYDELLKDVVHMFYLQRCGENLLADLAGDFAHPACHTGKAQIYGTNQTKDVSGGWHDAGDYGRYVVAGAKAVADLLLAYEENPEAFLDDTGTLESEKGQADLLDEVKYELCWMLKMQDENSGGVYHKVTCANFPGTVLAQEESEPLILAPVSNCATGDFAAVMAMASRIYEEKDKEFANQCLMAAKRALSYLEEHKTDAGFSNPPDIVTGEYGDGQCNDELFWALAELYKTTGEKAYQSRLAELGAENMNVAFGWADVAGYGMKTYLSCEEKDEALADVYRMALSNAADALCQTIQGDPYRSSIASVYPWGSNMTIANNGMLLCLLAKEKKQDAQRYYAFAQSQLSYLLGTNANSYCFVTGYGAQSPNHTHHRPSQAIAKTMKGMLVGGPNSNLEDPYAKAALSGKPNAKCYADNEQSYSCNEITIYWNSPLVYLLAVLVKI